MMRLITSIDKDYLPGLIALHNSIKENSPDTPLTCIVFGDSELIDQVESLGIEVISNPEMPDDLPVSELWPVASKAMYVRLIIPKLFSERCAWIDADCIVLKPIPDVEFSQPVAAVRTSTTTIQQQVPNIKHNGMKPALFSGFMIYNSPEWNRLQITEKCLKAMSEPLNFKYAVQSVLSYVLMGNFHILPDKWQVFANRSTTNSETIKSGLILHYVGISPWETKSRNQEIWEKYASIGDGRARVHRKVRSRKTKRPANLRQAKD